MPAEIPRLFVSYSREDAEFALKLATDLRARGTNIWVDQLDIRTGARWDSDVEAGLKASPGLLVILSPSSVVSQNVMDEVAFALSEGKWILPVRYKPCAIPLRLRRLQYVDFVDGYDEGLRRLVSDIASTFVAPPAAASTSTMPPADAEVPAPVVPPTPVAQAPTRAPVVPREPAAPPSPVAATSPQRPEPWQAPRADSDRPVHEDVAHPLLRKWRSLSLARKALTGLGLALLMLTALGVLVGELTPSSSVDPVSESAPDPASQGDASAAPPSTTPAPEAAPPAASWTAGSDHPSRPHVIASAKEGQWTPQDGYEWVDADAAGDLRVKWAPGQGHNRHDNVVAGAEEGKWTPAAGYEWINADDANDLRVRLKQRAAE